MKEVEYRKVPKEGKKKQRQDYLIFGFNRLHKNLLVFSNKKTNSYSQLKLENGYYTYKKNII